MSDTENSSVNWQPDARILVEKLQSVIASLEIARAAALKKHWMGIIICLFFVVLGIVAMVIVGKKQSFGSEWPYLSLMGGLLLAIAAYLCSANSALVDYNLKCKRELFAAAVKEIAPGMSYLPHKFVTDDFVHLGGIITERIDIYAGEDLFIGHVGSTLLTFSELNLQQTRIRANSKGQARTSIVTIFQGLYMVAKWKKDLRCNVKILPDEAEASLGWFGRKLQAIGGNLVRLSNPKFEQAFKVTSDDDVVAHYLLTPVMQERFLALRKVFSKNICAAFVNGDLHLAIPIKDNWFESNFKKHAGDVEVVQSFLDKMVLLLSITEMLDMNNPMWNKV